MRISFYIKLFIAFIVFAVLLLGFTFFAFNNFYNFYNEKKEKDSIENILKHQESSFKEYVKSFDEKMFLLTLKDFIKIEDKQKQLELFKKFLFVNQSVLEFSLISLDAQEIFKVTNSSGNLKIIENEKLQNIYSNSYYNRGLAKIALDQKDSGCLDFSKAGELGLSAAYEAIKEYCQ